MSSTATATKPAPPTLRFPPRDSMADTRAKSWTIVGELAIQLVSATKRAADLANWMGKERKDGGEELKNVERAQIFEEAEAKKIMRIANAIRAFSKAAAQDIVAEHDRRDLGI